MSGSRAGLAAVCLTCWSGIVWCGAVEDVAHAGLREELSEVARTTGWFGRMLGRGLSPAERVERLIDASWQWEMVISPESATFVGHPGNPDRWTDLSPEAIAAHEAMQAEILAAAESIPLDRLDADSRLNLELFLHRQRTRVAETAFPTEWLLVDPMNGWHVGIPMVLGAMPLGTRAEVEAYLTRLSGVAALLGQIQDHLRAGLAAGVTPPRVTLARVPDQIAPLLAADPMESGLLKPLDGMAEALPADFREQALARARQIYAESAAPAYRQLKSWLEAEYIPGARETTAFSALPDGQAWYAHQVAKYTTSDLSVADIHRIGVLEVERIGAQMRQLMAADGHRGSIPDYVAELHADPSQYYSDAQAQLTAYRALAKRADAALVKLFSGFPGLPYGIELMPAHRAAGSPVAYYLPGANELRRPGVFYINGSRVAEAPKYEMEALLLHEAVPGHHFQIALAQELGAMPEFRRNARFTAYIEGWGLYAESLGEELGFYTDPRARFGALTFEMWRAVRLVVDTGLHALGWSREQAIDYFYEHTGRDRDRVATEIDRYLVYPGQALAYKLGQLKIRELRERASAALGEAFDLRAFHEAVLGAGALPLTLLESRIDAWIETRRAVTP